MSLSVKCDTSNPGSSAGSVTDATEGGRTSFQTKAGLDHRCFQCSVNVLGGAAPLPSSPVLLIKVIGVTSN